MVAHNNDTLHYKDIYMGQIIIANVSWHECIQCGGRLFPLPTCKKIEAATKEIERYRLQAFPLQDFITEPQVAELLGLSIKQLREHNRVRRFVFNIEIGKETLFLKKSALLYKKCGDGRRYVLD